MPEQEFMRLRVFTAPVGTPPPNAGQACHDDRLYTIQESGVTGWDLVGEAIGTTKPICPECRDGKHSICVGYAWDPIRDEVTDCGCPHSNR